MRHGGLLHSSSSLRWGAEAAMAVMPLALWNHWAIQIQVLFSLSMQVLLLLFAGTRRREASIPRFFLWLAYQLADSTALYALGHLSVSSVLGEHRLVAFWAPFLVLHIGGPDNISAYALQDDELGLRHLQTFIVHVIGAAYVIYKRVAVNDSPLLLPGILIFAVGVVKYAERIWALKCSNISSIQNSLDKQPPVRQYHSHPDQVNSKGKAAEQDEIYVRRAHSLFHICKRAMVDSWLQRDSQGYWVQKDQKKQNIQVLETLWKEHYKGVWTLMEMELSLMYDLLYTKAGVVHTWSGYCIRFITPFATAASFLLFQFSAKDGHSRVDIAITYTLLAGAFLPETASLLSALGSTWTYAFLCATRWSWLQYVALCTGRWHRLRQFFKAITGRSGSKRSARRWSGKMGQYNMLHFCSRRGRAYIPLLGKLSEVRILGLKDWWVRYHYSGATDISDDLKQWLLGYAHV